MLTSSASNRRHLSLPLIFVYWASGALLISLAVWAPMGALLGRLVPDDGFYYLKIARNLALTGEQTFDGINSTNGFHPLWGYVLTGFMFLVGRLDTETSFRCAFALCAAVLVVAGWMFARVWRRFWPETWAVMLPLYSALLFFSYTYLMETALTLLITALLLEWLSKRLAVIGPSCSDSLMSWAWFGILLAALGLSRLDMVFLGGVALACAGWVAWRQGGIAHAARRMTVAAGTAALVIAPWLIWTRVTTGHWSTISGALKMGLARPEVTPANMLSIFNGIVWLSLAAGAAIIAAAVVAAANRRLTPALALAAVPAAGLVLHALFQALMVPVQGFAWTYALQRLLPVIAAGALAHALFRRKKGAGVYAVGAASIVLFLGVAVFYGYRMQRDFRERNVWTLHAWEAGRWVTENLPPNAVLGMRDAGVFGYSCERRVVNLDGLVNSWAYQEALRDDRHFEFMRNSGIDYLATHNAEDYTVDERYRFWFMSPYYGREATPLFLTPDDIIYRSEKFAQPPLNVFFVIWKWDGTAGEPLQSSS